MNRLLMLKVKRDVKDQKLVEEIVEIIQKKFEINENTNAFEIQNKINDKDYTDIIKKYKK